MTERLAIVLLRVLSRLPLPLLHRLAVPLAWIARFMPWRGHAVVRTNLAICFPDLGEAERERLYRRHLVEMMRLVLESGAVWYWPGDRLQRHVRQVDGWDDVVRTADRGKGVLLVGAHFGNWEILPLWVSLQQPITALYKAPRQAGFDRRVTQSRERFGARLVASGSPAMRKLIAGLRRGETIGLLADQQPKQGEGVFVNFFERPALTMTLVNRLARRTGCAVIFRKRRTPSRCARLATALRTGRRGHRRRGPGYRYQHHAPLARARDPAESGPVPLELQAFQPPARRPALALSGQEEKLSPAISPGA